MLSGYFKETPLRLLERNYPLIEHNRILKPATGRNCPLGYLLKDFELGKPRPNPSG